jgi:hypothetical protein
VVPLQDLMQQNAVREATQPDTQQDAARSQHSRRPHLHAPLHEPVAGVTVVVDSMLFLDILVPGGVLQQRSQARGGSHIAQETVVW